MDKSKEILSAIYAGKEKKRKVYPCHTNRASEIGHPCERYLVHNRLDWDKRILPPVDRQFVFDLGESTEREVSKDLEEAGFKITEQQRPLEWREFDITGRIDYMISKDSDTFPIEAKGMSPFIWESINSLDDFFLTVGDKYPYLKKYPGQLLLYLLMTNKPEGYFYLKNKSTGKPKILYVPLESYLEYAESLLQKAERINRFVTKKEYPDRIHCDRLCDGCDFAHICLPDSVAGPTEISEDTELKELLDRYLQLGTQLKPMKSEYEDVKEQINKKVKNKPHIFIGEHEIIGKLVENKGFTIKAYDYWSWKIIPKKDA